MKKGFCTNDLERVFLGERKDTGTFITVVGFDGAGKTTQINAIASEYRKHNIDVALTIQPTNWYRTQSIHHQFSNHGSAELQARIKALMSAADRLNHVHEVILPALNEGKIVICDRYVYTTFGVFIQKGLDSAFISEINRGIPKPDYAFYLSVPPEILLMRINERDKGEPNYKEPKIDKIISVVQTYEKMGSSLIKIDGNQAVSHVTNDIMKYINVC